MTFAEYVALRDANLDENFVRSAIDQFKQSYGAAKGSAEEQYDKYAPKAQEAIANVKSQAQEYAAKLGIPLPLATALLAAGLVNPASVPFAALMYFVKKPLMAVANKGFDVAWDAGAKAVNAVKGAMQPQQPQQQQAQQQPNKWPGNMQPVRAESFREFLAIMEAEGWGDWLGKKIGGAAGYLAGKAAGFGGKLKAAGGKVLSALKGRMGEIAQYAKNNPKEIARMAFLIGAGALIGAGIGKITHDVKDLIVQKIGDIGVPQEELAWLRSNVVIDKDVSADGTDTMFHNRGGDMFTEPGKNWDASHPVTDVGQTQAPEYISSQDHMSSDWNPVAGKGGDTTMSALTSKNDLGQVGTFDVTKSVTDAQGGSAPELGDVYRDLAKQMHSAGMMDKMRGLTVDPEYAKLAYGHDAGTEIAKRLASPDTLTGAGAIGGAAGTAAAQAGRKPRRA